MAQRKYQWIYYYADSKCDANGTKNTTHHIYIDGLVQERCNSSA